MKSYAGMGALVGFVFGAAWIMATFNWEMHAALAYFLTGIVFLGAICAAVGAVVGAIAYLIIPKRKTDDDSTAGRKVRPDGLGLTILAMAVIADIAAITIYTGASPFEGAVATFVVLPVAGMLTIFAIGFVVSWFVDS